MPNHTATKFIVEGPTEDVKRLQDAVRYEEGGKTVAFSCEAVLPMPPELHKVGKPVETFKTQKEIDAEIKKRKEVWGPLGGSVGEPILEKTSREYIRKYGHNNWYDWACANWGTKWDVYNVGKWKLSKPRGVRRAVLTWSSAWSPISPVIEKLSRDFPTLTLTLQFADEGGFFLGFEIYKGGEKTERSLEWDSSEGIELRKELGYWSPEEEDDE